LEGVSAAKDGLPEDAEAILSTRNQCRTVPGTVLLTILDPTVEIDTKSTAMNHAEDTLIILNRCRTIRILVWTTVLDPVGTSLAMNLK